MESLACGILYLLYSKILPQSIELSKICEKIYELCTQSEPNQQINKACRREMERWALRGSFLQCEIGCLLDKTDERVYNVFVFDTSTVFETRCNS